MCKFSAAVEKFSENLSGVKKIFDSHCTSSSIEGSIIGLSVIVSASIRQCTDNKAVIDRRLRPRCCHPGRSL